MSETLHLRTVAEGIETSDQTRALRSLGCEFGQGYHFARPLPQADMCKFIADAKMPPEQGTQRRASHPAKFSEPLVAA
jgi:EAL domain-containing protein (putative c-di-GMP-specific phosphodiesterase class I)